MKALTPARIFGNSLLMVCALAISGCSTPKPASPPSNSDFLKHVGFWNPSLLYLLDNPYPRLYVEVDAVEGCVPGDAELNQLHDFLVTYCNKPGGIVIQRSDVIPRNVARGLPARALARKYLNGPPDDSNAPPTAFLYAIYYENALSHETSVPAAPRLGAKLTPPHHARAANPHTDLLPYPAIMYIDTQYGPKSSQPFLLLHEAGHALGLVSRTNNASGGHCLSANCLMNAALRLHIRHMIFGGDPMEKGQKRLCPDCIAELAGRAKMPPPANLRFVGPVLVRSEKDYHVLSLPFRSKVIVGHLAAQDCRDFAADVHSESPAADDEEVGITALIKDEMLGNPEKLTDAINHINSDPYDILPLGLAQCFFEHGQFAITLDILRHVLRSDPENAWTYNQIAWILATCPNASVRNGKEAVIDATKACELTHWGYWNWIDTLAAACAEAGDFHRAIEFETRALRTGKPPATDINEMRQRLSSYRQSRPFRARM